MSKKTKEAFTLLELTISLFLLVVLTLLLALCLKTTMKTSERFLDFTNYEYALAHKKIFSSYVSSKKVESTSTSIYMKDDINKEEVRLVFASDEIYIQKLKNSNHFAGTILLLKKLSKREIKKEGEVVHVSYLDRNNHKREFYIRLKDEDKDKKDKEKDEKNKELSEKESNNEKNQS